MARLASDLWVAAYLRRLQLANIAAYVTRKGDPTAGAIVIKLATLDGSAQAFERRSDFMTGGWHWTVLAEGAERDVDAVLARARDRDPDLWILELEDRHGRHLLDEEGLAGPTGESSGGAGGMWA